MRPYIILIYKAQISCIPADARNIVFSQTRKTLKNEHTVPSATPPQGGSKRIQALCAAY